MDVSIATSDEEGSTAGLDESDEAGAARVVATTGFFAEPVNANARATPPPRSSTSVPTIQNVPEDPRRPARGGCP
jgi:hypothetical protein